ncbi:hypothetical protein K8W59_06825 [Nocardioides rotundus]|uniref:hypothetical protein n=1 Tax=Nocardioides rotundus TaxID=1774216 RepID=UPI001CBDCA5C|nr:hypothetical protein [Nocardioides rotundus]UAL31176.1 hypothetical protein K8W59_06825 [Nocardioides rotundus]
MDEITDYLATIDEKLDDVLRAQKDSVLAGAAGQVGDLATAAKAAESTARDHPSKARAVVHSRNHVGTAVVDFQGLLGIESGHHPVEARRWVEAASAVRDRARDAGAERVDAAKRLSTETRVRARSATSRLSDEIAQKARRRRSTDQDVVDDSDG